MKFKNFQHQIHKVFGALSLLFLMAISQKAIANVNNTSDGVVDLQVSLNLLETEVCFGEEVNLGFSYQPEVGHTYTYEWYINDVLYSTAEDTVLTFIDNTTTVRIEVLDDADPLCTGSDLITVNVNNKLIADIGETDTIRLCRDVFSKRFGAVSSSGGTPYIGRNDDYDYLWTTSDNNLSITDETLDSAIVRNDAGLNRHIGRVELEVTDSRGCVAYDTAYLKWDDSNFILLDNSVLKFCKGDLNTVNIIEIGPDPFVSFEWIVSSGTANFEISDNQKTMLLTEATNAFISVIATDADNCERRTPLAATDIVVDPEIFVTVDSVVVPNGTIFCVDDEIQLEVRFDSVSSHPYSQKWFVNDVIYAIGRDTTLITSQEVEVVVQLKDDLVECFGLDTITIQISDPTAVAGAEEIVELCPDIFDVMIDGSNSFGGVLRGGSEYSYEWTSWDANLTLDDSVSVNPTVTNIGGLNSYSGNIQLKITDDIGCEAFDTITLEWDDSDGISSDKDSLRFCEDDTDFALFSTFGALSLAGAYTATVIEGSATTSIRSNELSVSDADSATIQISVRGLDGCVYSTEVFADIVDVEFEFEAPIQACENSTVNVAVVTDDMSTGGLITHFYEWSIDGVILGNNDNVNFILTDTTIVNVSVTEAKYGCEREDSVMVLLSTPIGQIANGEDTTVVCPNISIAELSGSLTSGEFSTYEWNTKDARISLDNETNEDVTVEKIVDDEDIFTTVYLEFTNGFGCVNLDTTVIHWQEKIRLDIDYDELVCASVEDTLVASTTSELRGITWTSSSPITILSGVNDKTFIYDPNNISTDIEISILVENTSGCVNDTTLVLEIQDLELELSAISNTACSSVSVPITANVSDASDSILYNWDGINFLLNDSIQSFILSNDTTIRVSIFDKVTNCDASDNIMIMIEELMISATSGSDSICFEDSLLLEISSIQGGSGSYQTTWNGGELLVPVTANAIYVQPTITNGPVQEDYWYTVTDTLGCTATEFVVVTRNDEIISQVTQDTAICIGESVQLGQTTNVVGGSGSFTYQWVSSDGVLSSSTGDVTTFTPDNALSSSEVIFTIQDQVFTECSVVQIVTIDIQDGPLLSLDESIQICPGTTTTLDANVTESNITFSWLPGFEVSETISVSEPDQYTLEATSAIGCVSYDTIIVSLFDELEVELVGDQSAICLLESKEVFLTGASNTTVTWTGEGEELNDTTFIAIPTESAVGITVSARVVDVCNDIILDFIYEGLSTPVADFELSLSEIQVTQGFDLIDNSSNVENTNYTWTIDTGQVVTRQMTPTDFSVSQEGDFSAQLILFNTVTKCMDTADVVFEIIGRKNILFVPNAFYPKGTVDVNKRLRVLGSNISSDNFEFEIYNRWGERVYSTTSLDEAFDEGWDGFSSTGIETDNDDIAVFTYLIIGEFNDGIRINEGGTISLIK